MYTPMLRSRYWRKPYETGDDGRSDNGPTVHERAAYCISYRSSGECGVTLNDQRRLDHPLGGEDVESHGYRL